MLVPKLYLGTHLSWKLYFLKSKAAKYNFAIGFRYQVQLGNEHWGHSEEGPITITSTITITRVAVCVLIAAVAAEGETMSKPEQLTHAPHGHDLDNNDNFTPDGRYVVYDTRETIGPGIEHSTSIEMLDLETGDVTVLYDVGEHRTGANAAPGVGAVSFSPDGTEVAFIHGPPLDQLDARGPYAKTNRNGAMVRVAEPGVVHWLDYRDVATDRDTLPGAHRGGTHRHEYSRDGSRIGFTYDDHLVREHGRTIGYLEPHPDAPGGASHWFALLVRTVPEADAQPGDIVTALGDSWVDAEGTSRAFIGTIVEEEGGTQQSLFVADVPKSVDITTADAGGPDRYPSPPEGVTIRRLTYEWADGIVRGSYDGKRIAYYGKDDAGIRQLFVIDADATDARQVTSLDQDIEQSLRWHPSDEALLAISGGDVFMVSLKEADFGEVTWLTEGGDYSKLVIAPDGKSALFNGPGTGGARNYADEPFLQIFRMALP